MIYLIVSTIYLFILYDYTFSKLVIVFLIYNLFIFWLLFFLNHSLKIIEKIVKWYEELEN